MCEGVDYLDDLNENEECIDFSAQAMRKNALSAQMDFVLDSVIEASDEGHLNITILTLHDSFLEEISTWFTKHGYVCTLPTNKYNRRMFKISWE